MTDNRASANQYLTKEQLQIENSNKIAMNSNNLRNESEGIQSHALAMNNDPSRTCF